jgi:hypothetical protein
MATKVYLVTPSSLGWSVASDGVEWELDSQGAAWDRAVHSARNQWELCRRPAGVRLHFGDGFVVRQVDFGPNAIVGHYMPR